MTKFSYPKGDLKYYYEIHCARQQALGNTPSSYSNFCRRTRMMSLRDAIYKKRAEYNVRDNIPKTPIQDAIRRRAKLKEENIQVIDLDELRKLQEELFKDEEAKQVKTEVNSKKQTKTMIPKPKRSLLDRFISLFR